MKMKPLMRVIAAGALLSLAALPAVGQQNEAPERLQPISAVAAVVQGRVFQAPVGVRSTDTPAWARVAQGDEMERPGLELLAQERVGRAAPLRGGADVEREDGRRGVALGERAGERVVFARDDVEHRAGRWQPKGV